MASKEVTGESSSELEKPLSIFADQNTPKPQEENRPTPRNSQGEIELWTNNHPCILWKEQANHKRIKIKLAFAALSRRQGQIADTVLMENGVMVAITFMGEVTREASPDGQ